MNSSRRLAVWALPTLLCVTILALSPAWRDDWPQWRGPNRDGVWRETGVVEKFADQQLKIQLAASRSAAATAGRPWPTVGSSSPIGSSSRKQIERVHCFDAKTGEPLWTHSYDCVYEKVGYTAGPRASVTIDDGRAYSLGSMGHLFCLDAASGKVLWSKDLQRASTRSACRSGASPPRRWSKATW